MRAKAIKTYISKIKLCIKKYDYENMNLKAYQHIINGI